VTIDIVRRGGLQLGGADGVALATRSAVAAEMVAALIGLMITKAFGASRLPAERILAMGSALSLAFGTSSASRMPILAVLGDHDATCIAAHTSLGDDAGTVGTSGLISANLTDSAAEVAQ
jgi:Na+-driven multidrug efflux pump